MSIAARRWSVRLTQAAENDFQEIIEWTATRFGAVQAETYAETFAMAFEALAGGPDIVGAKPRFDILPGLFTLHVKRRRRKGRHFILFRVSVDNSSVIEVLRLLHDEMDLARHLPSASSSRTD